MKPIERPRILLVPYPAQGHVTPMLQLASALQLRGFEPVMVTPEYVHRQIAPRIEPKSGIICRSIPDGLDEKEPRDFFTIEFAMENNMPVHLERIICSFDEDGGVLCVVVDLLASWAIKVSKHCGVPVAGFWPAMLATYRLITAIPEMIRAGVISEFGIPQHQGKLCLLPNEPMLSIEDLPWLVGNLAARKSRFIFWLRTLSRSRTLRWVIVNSFPENGDEMIKQQRKSVESPPENPPHVFQVGPLSCHSGSKNPSFWEEDRSCLDWLNKHKACSVIYVSFGSWVKPLGEEKLNELALGLEASRRPFLWVVGPSWQERFPIGYLGRLAGRGKVVSWAPQMEVLKHEAIGCYLTHCGWNSTMEAIQSGKCLLCYPVAGDQFVNCTYIVNVWKIGVKIDGFGWRDVEEGVRSVMEDEGEMHQRVMELKARVIAKEGSSRAVASLTAFIDDLQ
ncbi:hypothetical protein HHK36_023221 [Tetracentron sinense]|uniref:Glycosyltransferase n=1 Tax=Tetracentron sinense TaxID=13715 RepID=A0A834YRZ3_TETSI|nr:hypothetical protein HHK36_023221 [Tetracentron sinense]